MLFRFDKRKAVYVLFAAVLILIISNLLVKKIFIKNPVEYPIVQWQASVVDEKFFKILKDFGIDEKLIKRKEIKNGKNRNSNFTYKIEVPSDLPIPVILDDVFTEFSATGIEIFSREKETGGKSLLEISTNKKKIISAEFRYSKDIVRKKGMIGIMITQFEIDDSKDSIFFDIPESFCVLLPPSKSNSKAASYISKKNKEYAVLIDDNIVELEYKLAGNYSVQRIKNIVRTIVGNFSKAVFIVFDDRSDFYGSEGFKIVVAELGKRKIKHITLSKLIILNVENSSVIPNSFEKIISELDSKDKQMVLLTREGFNLVLPSIAYFRKSGVKFVNPSLIMKK